MRRLIGDDTSVFHLAAIVSADAEQNFDLGMAVNLGGTRNVLDACRALAKPARVVFASSVAVYGGDMPEVLNDGTILTPQTSYGMQKAASELLLNDYGRKGFVDGRALRLPTIVVRPGKPNKAASTFASSIVREPLAGQEAICPVERDAEMYILSPRRVVEALIHAFELPADAFGMTRMLTLPGITASIGAMVDALERGGRRAHGPAHPVAARSGDPEDCRRLARPLRRPPCARHGLSGGCRFDRDHPRPHRGRAWRRDQVAPRRRRRLCEAQLPNSRMRRADSPS